MAWHYGLRLSTVRVCGFTAEDCPWAREVALIPVDAPAHAGLIRGGFLTESRMLIDTLNTRIHQDRASFGSWRMAIPRSLWLSMPASPR
jgi:hypothetical protein